MLGIDSAKQVLQKALNTPKCGECGEKLFFENQRFEPDITDYSRIKNLMLVSTTTVIIGLAIVAYTLLFEPTDVLGQVGIYTVLTGLTVFIGAFVAFLIRSSADTHRFLEDVGMNCIECTQKELMRKSKELRDLKEVRLKPVEEKEVEFEGFK